ncbi:OLC1v1038385C1 [Oldenlandia corymbosa var. corymbosa]|uniref:ATP-dependent RNA helicase n=1 Tax=Oldenlandia corymbosa var. corymbosa TaxID=529605 RepID=A0AAV1D3E6_OLDCO|nr:OLC1v1038385C1 [Oldenlandia corymbosa var. corymbosa]
MPIWPKLLPAGRVPPIHSSYLLHPAATITMKTLPNLKPTRAIDIFSRVFPHRLKFQSFLRFPVGSSAHYPGRNEQIRALSTRGRRTASGSGDGGGGGIVRAGAGARSKSLMEDEADLSDWVSGLSSKSFNKTQLYSDDSDDDRGRNTSSSRNRRDDGREERGGKRRRDSDFTDFRANSVRRGGPRDSAHSFPKRRESDFDNFGSSNRRGGPRDRQRGMESNDRFSRGSKDREGGGDNMFRRNGRDSKDGFLRGRDANGRSSGLRVRPGGGNQGRREGSGMDFGRSSKRNNLGRGRFVSDEDEEVEDENDKSYMSFKELIDSEEGSEVDDFDSNDEVVDDALEEENVFSQARSEGTTVRAPPSSSAEGSDSYLSESRFDQCPVSPLSLKALKDVGYDKMTVVQEATLPVILKGKDVLAKAKTGTGKTVAFLLPSIEVVVNSPSAARDQKRPPILVLVICPTRELASQAAKEANTLLKYHPSIGVQVVIGGTRLALEQKRMQANPCQILVATPGRLRDHIENTAGFATRLMGVKVLVLDEADHLLDMGFRRDIEKIIDAVPKQRQTLLFSATIPKEVRSICHIALKRDHEYVNTVEEGSEETHSKVRQMHMVAPLEKHFTLLYTLLKEHTAADVDYKVLVFCTTAMVTKLVADLLGELNLNVREIHSRKPQSYRTRISDEFRKSKGLILVTSDVSARGVDYPDVTLVVQIGLPADRQQYIHRLGRTGRKGKEGQGILMLAPWEEFFLSTIKDLPVTKAEEPLVDPETKKKVERALSHVEMKSKETAYQAWLGYYNSNKTVGRDKYRLVELANEFSRSMGLDNPPAIPKLVLGKMGLKNIPGLRSR